jgi:hypothetical protein
VSWRRGHPPTEEAAHANDRPFAQVEARAEGAWCILDSDGCTNCAFQTRAQCLASATGTGGSCVRNVNASASADARARKQRPN